MPGGAQWCQGQGGRQVAPDRLNKKHSRWIDCSVLVFSPHESGAMNPRKPQHERGSIFQLPPTYTLFTIKIHNIMSLYFHFNSKLQNTTMRRLHNHCNANFTYSLSVKTDRALLFL